MITNRTRENGEWLRSLDHPISLERLLKMNVDFRVALQKLDDQLRVQLKQIMHSEKLNFFEFADKLAIRQEDMTNFLCGKPATNRIWEAVTQYAKGKK